ncbi:DNA polymerase III subunit delta [Sodalis-like secondary symbiont of Drepanosiphum platanoidis]|uniref:DNA polymerase III subunit delta n=1 Tax=Sodalis-like secondary symbiont of Drepanosiphum platanoidis TaxID=2994493 RepID=UPI00346447DD
MINLPFYKLEKHLNNYTYNCYFLFGNNILFLQESQNYIFNKLKKKLYECTTIILNNKNDWNYIFMIFQTFSLFSYKKSLLLILPENGTNNLIDKNLEILSSLIHKDIILIIRSNNILSKKEKRKKWFKNLSTLSILIDCNNPISSKISEWIYNRAKNFKIILDKNSCDFLSYNYNGNLLALNQIFQQLRQIYFNKNINFKKIKKFIINLSYFTPINWTDAIFLKKIKYSYHILNKLKLLSIDPIILLRTIQREIYLLLKIKKKLIKNYSLKYLFYKYKIWKNKQEIQKYALKNFKFNKIKKILKLMIKIELIIKKYNTDLAWEELNMLTYFLCK